MTASPTPETLLDALEAHINKWDSARDDFALRCVTLLRQALAPQPMERPDRRGWWMVYPRDKLGWPTTDECCPDVWFGSHFVCQAAIDQGWYAKGKRYLWWPIPYPQLPAPQAQKDAR